MQDSKYTETLDGKVLKTKPIKAADLRNHPALYRFTTVLKELSHVHGMLIIEPNHLASFCHGKMETTIYDYDCPGSSADYICKKVDFEMMTQDSATIEELKKHSQKFNHHSIWVVCGVTPFGVYEKKAT